MSFLDDGTAEVLQRRIESGTAEPEDYRLLGEYLLLRAKPGEAEKIYRAALRLRVDAINRAGFAADLASVLYNIGRSSEARQVSEEALSQLSREAPSTEVLLLRSLHSSTLAHCISVTDAEAGARACSLALRMLEEISFRADLHEKWKVFCELARLHMLVGDSSATVAACQNALAQDGLPAHERAACLVLMAEALRVSGCLSEANRFLKEALRDPEANPNLLPVIYLTLGLVERESQRTVEARGSLLTALNLTQDHPVLRSDGEMLRSIYGNLAEIYYDLKDYRGTLGALHRLLEREAPRSANYYRIVTWIGDCHSHLGETGKARSYYHQVLASSAADHDVKEEARQGLASLPREDVR